jgi:hypothetical protein
LLLLLLLGGLRYSGKGKEGVIIHVVNRSVVSGGFGTKLYGVSMLHHAETQGPGSRQTKDINQMRITMV